MKKSERNRTIATLIKWFKDKRSGKVTESREEIQRRFYGLDWKDQKKILFAFLESGKADRQWAYAKLLDYWDDCFISLVANLWEDLQEERCGWVVVRHLPEDYLIKHLSVFTNEGDYYYLCRRLAGSKDFSIDKERLTPCQYLAVAASSGIAMTEDEAMDQLRMVVQQLCESSNPSLRLRRWTFVRREEPFSMTEFSPISTAVYYIENIGLQKVVNRFRAWDEAVQYSIRKDEQFLRLNTWPISDSDYTEELCHITTEHMRNMLNELL